MLCAQLKQRDVHVFAPLLRTRGKYPPRVGTCVHEGLRGERMRRWTPPNLTRRLASMYRKLYHRGRFVGVLVQVGSTRAWRRSLPTHLVVKSG